MITKRDDFLSAVKAYMSSRPCLYTPVPNYTHCLITGAYGCEQLAQSGYAAAPWPAIKLATSLIDRKSEPLCHHATQKHDTLCCF